MALSIGSRVRRIVQDNFPVAKVGDIGEVVAASDYTIKCFGRILPSGMVLVSFNGDKPSPNITKYLEEL